MKIFKPGDKVRIKSLFSHTNDNPVLTISEVRTIYGSSSNDILYRYYTFKERPGEIAYEHWLEEVSI